VEVRRKKLRRGPAPGELLVKESAALPGSRTVGAKENRKKSLVRSSYRADASTGQNAEQWQPRIGL